MKKKIEIIEKSKRTIEIEVPSFYNSYGIITAITDLAIIRVWPDMNLVSFISVTNKDRYDKEVAEIIIDRVKPAAISQQEFETAFNNTIKCLTEQYQLSMSMVLDPNTQTAEGQQAEETAALESATQDNAMEVSAKEGGTEG